MQVRVLGRSGLPCVLWDLRVEGRGAVSYDDGDKYRGQWNGEGKRHGLGVVRCEVLLLVDVRRGVGVGCVAVVTSTSTMSILVV